MARIKFFKGSKKTYIDHINDSKYLDSLYFTIPNTEIDPSHGTLYINNIAYDGIEIVNVSTDLSSLTNTRLGQIVFSKGDHASFLHIDDQTWSQLGTTSTIDINSLNAKVDDLSIFTHNLNSSLDALNTSIGNNYITQVTYYQDISTHADDGSVYVKGINISAIPQWEENN